MTARSPDPAAEAVRALRTQIIMAVRNCISIGDRTPRWLEAIGDEIIGGPLAQLLADIAALRTHVGELQGLLTTQEICADKLKADRDRLAEENARLREALEFYGQDDVWRLHGECNPEHAWFTGPETARRALTATGGTTDDPA